MPLIICNSCWTENMIDSLLTKEWRMRKDSTKLVWLYNTPESSYQAEINALCNGYKNRHDWCHF